MKKTRYLSAALAVASCTVISAGAACVNNTQTFSTNTNMATMIECYLGCKEVGLSCDQLVPYDADCFSRYATKSIDILLECGLLNGDKFYNEYPFVWETIPCDTVPCQPQCGIPNENQNVQTPDSNAQTETEPTAEPEAKPSTEPEAKPSKPNNETQQNQNNNASTNTSASNFYAEVLRLVNIERAAYGLSALTTTDALQSAANVRASELKTTFSHNRPNGSSCFTALSEAGISYSTAGENIAWGQRTPEAVVKAWMESQGHRENILKSSFKQLGVGYVEVNGTPYWSQLFIG